MHTPMDTLLSLNRGARPPHHPHISHPDSHRTESWAFVAPKKRERPGSLFFEVLPSVCHSPFSASAAICGRRHAQMSASASHTAAKLPQRKGASPCRVKGHGAYLFLVALHPGVCEGVEHLAELGREVRHGAEAVPE